MELSGIKGLGPAKQEALHDAGIGTLVDLGGLDLRRHVEVQGGTQDALKSLKQPTWSTLEDISPIGTLALAGAHG